MMCNFGRFHALALAAAFCAVQLPASEAFAEKLVTIAAFDVNNGASPTQANFEGLASTGAGTQNGVSLTSTVLDEFRDRGPGGGGAGHILGNPMSDLLRDFGFENDASSVTFDLAGLLPDTEYFVSVYGYDGAGNGGTTTDYFQDMVGGTPLGTTVNNGPNPDLSEASFFVTSDALGGISLIANQRAGTPNIILFNGLSISQVVPEPTSIMLWSLIGLGLAGLGLFRARRTK